MYSHSRGKRRSDCEILLNSETLYVGKKRLTDRISYWLKENYAIVPCFGCLFLVVIFIALSFSGILPNAPKGKVQRVHKYFSRHVPVGPPQWDEDEELKKQKPIEKESKIEGILHSVENLSSISVVDTLEAEVNLTNPEVNVTSSDITSHNVSVGFLLPLTGPQSNLGYTFGQKLKRVLVDKGKAHNSSSEILVRDSQGESVIARDLTRHFYEYHGTRTFFGYVTDDEALGVSAWGRSHAPGARFISPTATSILLERALNFESVQPSSKFLSASIADFLLMTGFESKVIIVTQASISKDTFISLLKVYGVKPAEIIYYYEWKNVTEATRALRVVLKKCPYCVVLLLGDYESWSFLTECDSLFAATWILPFPSQLRIRPTTLRADIVSFQYRPYDYVAREFLKSDELLDIVNATVNATLQLILNSTRSWRGSYCVSLHLSGESKANDYVSLSENDGWQPFLQYDLTDRGVVRTQYQNLLVSTKALNELLFTKDVCDLIIRFMEETSGQILVHRGHPSSTILVPVTRGAQIHYDCPNQHSDIRCTESDSENKITCSGTLFGNHNLRHQCRTEVEVELEVAQPCVLSGIEGCPDHNNSFRCRLAKLCPPNSKPRGFTKCNGFVLVSSA